VKREKRKKKKKKKKKGRTKIAKKKKETERRKEKRKKERIGQREMKWRLMVMMWRFMAQRIRNGRRIKKRSIKDATMTRQMI
jgi:hypothetical protein